MVMFACAAVGLVIEPIVPAGAPCAMQTARRLALAVGAAPEQGSMPRLVRIVLFGVNSSEMFGERTALA